MSPPIRDGSGSKISSIRLGDGTEISEARTGAGDLLFSGLPIDLVDNFNKVLYEDRGKSLSDYYDVSYFSRSNPSRSIDGSYSAYPDLAANNCWMASMDDSSKNDLLPRYPQAGDTVVWYHRAESTGSWSALNTLAVGLQSHDGSDPTENNGYQLKADYANSAHEIQKDGNTLTFESISFGNYTGEWLRSEFVWGSNGSLTYTVYDSNGNSINQLTATDSAYSSGGIGYMASVDSVGDFHVDNIHIK